MNEEPFSKRHGFQRPAEAGISVRQDAPYEFRGVLIQLAYEYGFRPKTLRTIVCRILRKRPDDANWSEYPNIDEEIRQLIDECEWYKVYDVAEGIYGTMIQTPYSYDFERFDRELNNYFVERVFKEFPVTVQWNLFPKRLQLTMKMLPKIVLIFRAAISSQQAPVG